MEHSYLGDLEIRLVSPTGQSIILKAYPGGGGTYLGCAIDGGAGPGTGRDYCFTPIATTFMVNGATSACGTPSFNSINEGNYVHFPQGVKDYIKYCQLEEGDRPYTSRYIGSLVSDFHRNMIKGGIYLYPTSSKAPNGKLRLLYECNPMAFIAEQAGGKASDGYKRIMEIQPTELHQRVPFFCGSKNMVEKAEEFMAKAK